MSLGTAAIGVTADGLVVLNVSFVARDPQPNSAYAVVTWTISGGPLSPCCRS
jgi:hypothetical protein